MNPALYQVLVKPHSSGFQEMGFHKFICKVLSWLITVLNLIHKTFGMTLYY